MAFFNPLRPSYIDDPYPALHRLRAEEPVHRAEQLSAWIVTSHEHCLDVLRDHETYSSTLRGAEGPLGRHIEHQRRETVLRDAARMAQSDPPEHTRLRGIVSRTFTPRYVESLRPFVEREVARLLEGVQPSEPWDVLSGLARPLPIAVIAEQLGAPSGDREQVMAWTRSLLQLASAADLSPQRRREAEAARDGMLDYLERVARGESGEPGALITALARTVGDDERLQPMELLALTVDLAIAGNDTTAGMLANGTLALARHPEQQEILRREPAHLRDAIEEMLRWDPPTQTAVRVAAKEARLGKRTIRPGQTVIAMLAAANRDPAVFRDPDRFDVTREAEGRHLAFGMGIHYCLGAPLARIEAETAFRALLDRFDVIRLSEGADLARSPDWMLRGVQRLPLDTKAMPDR